MPSGPARAIQRPPAFRRKVFVPGGDQLRIPQSLELGYRRDGRDVVVVIRGEVDLASAPRLEYGLFDLIEQGNLSIVLDLRDLQFIDSTGLAVLTKARERAHREGSQFALMHLPATAKRLLEILGELSAFDLRDDGSPMSGPPMSDAR